jgi:hypothetical protein
VHSFLKAITELLLPGDTLLEAFAPTVILVSQRVSTMNSETHQPIQLVHCGVDSQ